MTILQARETPAAPRPQPDDPAVPGRSPAAIHLAWSRLPDRLARLASARASAEASCRTLHEARVGRAEAALRDALASADKQRDTDSAELAALVASSRHGANEEFAAETRRDRGRAPGASQVVRRQVPQRPGEGQVGPRVRPLGGGHDLRERREGRERVDEGDRGDPGRRGPVARSPSRRDRPVGDLVPRLLAQEPSRAGRRGPCPARG